MISVNSCVRVGILIRFQCIYLRDDDVGAFMCEGQDIGAFT